MDNKANSSEKAVKKEKMHISVLITIIVAVIVVAAAFGYAVWRNSDAVFENSVAVTVGDTEIYGPEFSYYYYNAVNYFLETYSASGLLDYLGIDTSVSLATQECSFDSEITWAEYFAESAISNIEQTYVLYLESQKAGFEVNQEEIDETISSYRTAFEENASENNMSVDDYISLAYGDGVTWDRFVTYAEKALAASQYQESITDGISVNDDEITTYLNDNPYAYYELNYRSVSYSYTADDEESKTEAKSNADEFAANATSEQAYIDLAWANLAEETQTQYEEDGNTDYSLRTGISASSVPEAAADWMLSSERTEGDVTVIDNSDANNYTIYYFVSSALKDYKVVNLREIYIADTEDNAESIAAEIMEKWESSSKTEDDFIALVSEYNPDSLTEGLYENVTADYMPEAIDSWIFEDGRAPGDVSSIHDDTEGSEGYHIVYYVSQGEEYWKYAIRNSLISQKYNEQYTSMAGNYETTQNDNVVSRVIGI